MIITMIVIALAVATISMTITKSSLFECIQKYKLLQCPYCAAHWISFLIWSRYIAIYPNTVTLFDFIISVFATVALSVLPMIAIDYFNTKVDRHAKILHSTSRSL